MGISEAPRKGVLEFSSYEINTGLAAILAVFVVAIAAIIVVVFNLAAVSPSEQQAAAETSPIVKEPQTVDFRPSPSSPPPIGNGSMPFSLISTVKDCGELVDDAEACGNAAELALAKYPGKMFVVEKFGNVFGSSNDTVWIVGIDPEKELQVAGKDSMARIRVLVSGDGDARLYGGSL